MVRRRSTVGVIAVAVAVVLPGCTREGLAFREDERVEIVAPGDRDTVALPVRVAWATSGLPRNSRFAVFVDATPQPPGETLDWIARDDDACAARPDCPDERYLAERYIQVTENPSVDIALVPVRNADRRFRDFHEVTVVLLDDEGRRQGEASWSVQFRVDD